MFIFTKQHAYTLKEFFQFLSRFSSQNPMNKPSFLQICFHHWWWKQKLTISLISIYKHYAIDIADPSSAQDVCRKHSPWSLYGSVARTSERFLMGTQNFFLCPALVTRRKKHLSLSLMMLRCYGPQPGFERQTQHFSATIKIKWTNHSLM